MSGALRLLADDLTGALDAAAPFAAARGPIAVRWTGRFAARSDLAFDSETRDAAEPEAVARVRGLAAALGEGTPAFKKIDSLLRPNTVAEIAAIWSSGRFASLAVAPAFPEQGRRLRGGRLVVGDGPAGLDLLQALGDRGLPAVGLSRGEQPARPGVYVCDAETDADLDALARTFAPPCLWVGSAGLARAVSGRQPSVRLPANGPPLVLIGTRHPATRRQVACVRPLALCAPDEAEAVAAAALARIAAGRACAILLDVPGEDARAARAAWTALARCLARSSPGFVVVVGGESLRRLCDGLGASHLLAEGEVSPGVPRARFVGGSWDGMALVSKSGAFDDGGLLARLLHAPSEATT